MKNIEFISESELKVDGVKFVPEASKQKVNHPFTVAISDSYCTYEYCLKIGRSHSVSSVAKTIFKAFGLKEELGTLKRPILSEKVSEPEFQIGQWYVWGKYIYRVINIDNYWVYVQEDCSYIPGEPKFRIKSDWGDNSRPATEAEIESHLRKICDEKYIGKKVKCVCGECSKSKSADTIDKFKKYYPEQDLLCYFGSDGCEIAVYKQGKFADIIPDKKPRPKTREDHKKFIADFCKFGNIRPYLATYHESFLDQYDFEL